VAALVDHPGQSQGALARLVESLRWRRNAELSRCAKACFCDAEDPKVLTVEAERLLADLRDRADLFGSSIKRDQKGAIDPLEAVRMEGRREIVLRIINLLELDPQRAARFVEVDNGQI
jgi:hypothetical protein